METVLYHLTTLAVAAVVVVLVVGLWNLTRGTSPNLSQKLMRWRVGLQFVAIVIIMLFVYVRYGLAPAASETQLTLCWQTGLKG